MASKNGFAISESDRRLIRDHASYVREALFACTTETQVECAVGFARFLSRAGINGENYWLFLRLLMTNNPWVIDELLHDREPRLLFSTVRPDAEFVEAAFQALFCRHPEELYPKALEALLGIVQNAYFDPDDGYRMRPLSIMDINALGKFLLKDEPQEHPQNRLLLEILDRLTHLGEYYGEPDKNVLSKHAFRVRYAYFDRTRELVDAIPGPLLVRLPDRAGVPPEEDFADLVSKRRARKRDAAGRFVRESPAEPPLPAAPAQAAPAPGTPAPPAARDAAPASVAPAGPAPASAEEGAQGSGASAPAEAEGRRKAQPPRGARAAPKPPAEEAPPRAPLARKPSGKTGGSSGRAGGAGPGRGGRKKPGS